ncbi:unnamed protein product [Rotaria sp. Silwood1]|nr:unnamed protein product [Rotaria sp. Silwood1]
MPSTIDKSILYKYDYQKLVNNNDPSISLIKPSHTRTELWSKFSQLHHLNISQNYIVCNTCRAVLKWSSETASPGMPLPSFWMPLASAGMPLASAGMPLASAGMPLASPEMPLASPGIHLPSAGMHLAFLGCY